MYISYRRMNHLDPEKERVFIEHNMLMFKTPPTFICYAIEKKASAVVNAVAVDAFVKL